MGCMNLGALGAPDTPRIKSPSLHLAIDLQGLAPVCHLSPVAAPGSAGCSRVSVVPRVYPKAGSIHLRASSQPVPCSVTSPFYPHCSLDTISDSPTPMPLQICLSSSKPKLCLLCNNTPWWVPENLNLMACSTMSSWWHFPLTK